MLRYWSFCPKLRKRGCLTCHLTRGTSLCNNGKIWNKSYRNWEEKLERVHRYVKKYKESKCKQNC
jgi:hypothetical protein